MPPIADLLAEPTTTAGVSLPESDPEPEPEPEPDPDPDPEEPVLVATGHSAPEQVGTSETTGCSGVPQLSSQGL
jgi:hypothetical protein